MKIINHLPKWVRMIYFRYKITHTYDDFVNMAEQKHHELNGERIYVVPGIMGAPTLYTKAGFKCMKNKGVFKKNINMNDVHKACIYYTAAQYERDPISEEERIMRRDQYIKWFLDTYVA